jgi:hypothetical protein
MIKEGDFVMGSTSEGVVHGVVEHIMNEGGTLGTPGSEYALVSMPPENPAMSVRIYEEEDGTWEPTAYSIGMMYQDATIADMENHIMDSELGMAMYDSSIGKSHCCPEQSSIDKAYQGCGCETCKELDVDCPDCPVCQDEMSKQAPCWDGYVQRGMKPGKDGKPVPNCVPVAKSNSMFSGFGKDHTTSQSLTHIFKTDGNGQN